jgi:hypothetical protein
VKKKLLLDYVSHAAALFSVRRWHYTRSLPPPPHVRVGVWEDDVFVGVVIFARGACSALLQPYGLSQVDGCELVRVALNKTHVTPVSRIVAIAIKKLRECCPGVVLIVSFADPEQGHVGGIYQAGGWVYAGQSQPSPMWLDRNGRRWHQRMVTVSGMGRVFGAPRKVQKKDECERIIVPGKHRYLMPLTAQTKLLVAPLAKPYPKKACAVVDGSAVPLLTGVRPDPHALRSR